MRSLVRIGSQRLRIASREEPDGVGNLLVAEESKEKDDAPTPRDVVTLFGADRCLWGDDEQATVMRCFDHLCVQGLLDLAKVR